MIQRVVLLAIFCVPLLLNSSDGARILGVFPSPAPSHYYLGSTLMKGLAEAGHDITIMSPFTDKYPPKNGTWREIILSNVLAITMKHFYRFSKFGASNAARTLNAMGNSITEGTLQNADVQKLIQSDEKFDVVIVSQFANDALKVLAPHFNAHLILFSNNPSDSLINYFVGNPSFPSFHSESFLNFSPKMTFFERLQNTLSKLILMLNFNLLTYPKHNELIEKYFPKFIDLNDVIYNVSLVLVNSHPSIADPQPTVPCIIEIGGFHIHPPKKLPDDLQWYLDNSAEGVIYFSLGSNPQSKTLPDEKKNALLKSFSKRKENVLWKWDGDEITERPPNVDLGQLLPQQDILAHPNVKAFITHGDMLSTTEAIYEGVPIIGIPIVGDQVANAKAAEIAGNGLVLPYDELTEEKLSSLIDAVINNPVYRENVKQKSVIMKDRQIHPLDSAIYWVEYVIRHNGAAHLRVPYLHLTWYQYYLLDVFGFIFGVVLITILALAKVVSYFRSGKKSDIVEISEKENDEKQDSKKETDKKKGRKKKQKTQ